MAHIACDLINTQVGLSVAQNVFPFREEGITYNLVRLWSQSLSGGSVRVFEIPRHKEAKNGADLEVWQRHLGGWRGWLIQAKRPRGSRPPTAFPHIQDQNKYGVQSDLLIKSSQARPGSFPVYFFYGFLEKGLPDCEALLVLDAWTVQELAKPASVGRKRPSGWSRRDRIRKYGSTLCDLWCSSSSASLQDATVILRRNASYALDNLQADTVRPLDEPIADAPAEIRSLLEGQDPPEGILSRHVLIADDNMQ